MAAVPRLEWRRRKAQAFAPEHHPVVAERRAAAAAFVTDAAGARHRSSNRL